MWLSASGNLRMDVAAGKYFEFSRWDEKRQDWISLGGTDSESRAERFARDMKMTYYPDVPDHPPA